MKRFAFLIMGAVLGSAAGGCVSNTEQSTGELRADLVRVEAEIRQRRVTEHAEERRAALDAAGKSLSESERMDSLRAIQDSVLTPAIRSRLAALAERARTEDPNLYRAGNEAHQKAERRAQDRLGTSHSSDL